MEGAKTEEEEGSVVETTLRSGARTGCTVVGARVQRPECWDRMFSSAAR